VSGSFIGSTTLCFFLFNDLLLFATKEKGLINKSVSYKVKEMAELEKVEGEKVKKSNQRFSFFLLLILLLLKEVAKVKVGETVFQLSFSSEEERDNWLQS